MNIRIAVQRLYKRVLSSGFLKSVLTLSSGVVVAQAINFLGMPIVGRIYNPSAMGDYTLITANAATISAVACLGMMTSFMLPEKHEEARGLSRLVVYSTVLITTLAVVVLWMCRGFFRVFHTEQVSYAVSLTVLWLYIVFNTVSNICYAYVNRHKLYRVMFWNPIITAGINVGVGIMFGLLGWGFLGYTAAHILSFVVNILHLSYHANAFEKITGPTFPCISLLKNYKRFPLYQMPANLISSLATQLPAQMIEVLYSSTVLGMYSMALKILSLPVTLLATPINRVYFQEASQRYNKGQDIGDFSFKILKTNIKIAIIPISLLIIFGEQIFALFLGKQWEGAGTFAAILGLYQLMQFCGGCLSGDFVILRRNYVELYLVLFQLFCNAGVFWISARYIQNMAVSVFLISVVGILKEVVQRGVFLRLSGVPLFEYLWFVCKYICFPVGTAWGIRVLLFHNVMILC